MYSNLFTYWHLYRAFSIVQHVLYRYEMMRYKGTQANNLCEKSMHTLYSICEQPHQGEVSTILDPSLSHTYAHSAICSFTEDLLLWYLTSDTRF